MPARKKWWQPLYIVYALILFLLPMLLVFIWAVVVLPLGRIRSGNLIYRACMLWGDVWFWAAGIRHQNIYRHKPDKKKACIFIANHISYMDTPSIVKAIRQPVRPLAMIEMTKIPVFGFIYGRVAVTVDRSSAANRSKSIRILKDLLNKGVSVLVFPEGSLNTSSEPLKPFYDGAFRIAIETGTAIQPILFLDTFERMQYAQLATINPGRNRVLFLKPIPVDAYALNDVKALKEKAHNMMQEALLQHGALWINKAV